VDGGQRLAGARSAVEQEAALDLTAGFAQTLRLFPKLSVCRSIRPSTPRGARRLVTTVRDVRCRFVTSCSVEGWLHTDA
jgi:hypothetical protein